MTVLVDIVALLFGAVLETVQDAWDTAGPWMRAGVITLVVLVLLLAVVCLTGCSPTVSTNPNTWAAKP